MDEKNLVGDILSQVKSSLTSYATAITECENMQLRQTLQHRRRRIRGATKSGGALRCRLIH